MKAFKITKCKACGSNDLFWFSSVSNNSGIQDGRLRFHDIQVQYILGCNYCSEPLACISDDAVVEQMNINQGFVQE